MSTVPDGLAAQHAKLSEGISQFQRDLEAGASWQQLTISMDGVIAELERHFQREEELMRVGDYPAVEGHKKEHAAFLMRVRALRSQCKSFQKELLSALAETLTAWLTKHERTSDRVAAEFLGVDDW